MGSGWWVKEERLGGLYWNLSAKVDGGCDEGPN